MPMALFATNFPKLPERICGVALSPKTEITDNLALQRIAPLIHEIRGERVILDSDLATIYGVETRVLNQAVKRIRKDSLLILSFN